MRYDGEVKTQPNGQQQITRNRPKLSQIHEHIEYGKGIGQCYSLCMGRAYKPHKYAILLDLGNKVKCDAKSGVRFGRWTHLWTSMMHLNNSPPQVAYMSILYVHKNGAYRNKYMHFIWR